MHLLVVGKEDAFLSTVAMALDREGVMATTASTRVALERALATKPQAVVFNHVNLGTLMTLNPRDLGYVGPLLLMTDGLYQELAEALLQPSRALWKPFHLESLYDTLAVLLDAVIL